MALLIKLHLSAIIALVIVSCQPKKEDKKRPSILNLIVSNESRTTPDILMTITLDDSLIVKKKFSYQETSIEPHIISFPVKKGLHTIMAKTSSNRELFRKEVLLGDSTTNVFVAYIYHNPTAEEIQAERKIMHTSKIDTLTLGVTPSIVFHTTKGKLLLQ